MTEGNAVVKRVEVTDDLPPLERIKLLLRAKGYRSIAAWSRHRGFEETAVWHAITGRRPNAKRTPEILDALATDTGRDRSVIDALVAREPGVES